MGWNGPERSSSSIPLPLQEHDSRAITQKIDTSVGMPLPVEALGAQPHWGVQSTSREAEEIKLGTWKQRQQKASFVAGEFVSDSGDCTGT